jgi:hypothetical protein
VICHQFTVVPHEVSCSAEFYKQRSCKRIGLPTPAMTSLFPKSLARYYFAAGPRPIASSGSSSHELRPFFRALTVPTLPRTQVRVAPPLEFLSSSRHEQREATCKRNFQAPFYAPPSAFLTLSAVYSAPCLAGLFHPTTASRIDLSRVCSRYQGGPSHR